MNEGQLLLLWPGEVRRKREGDFGQIGPALLAGTNNRPSFINKIPSTSYLRTFNHNQNASIDCLKVMRAIRISYVWYLS